MWKSVNTSLPGQMKIKSGKRAKISLEFLQRCSIASCIAKTSEIFVSFCLLVECYFNFVLVKMFNHRIVRSRSTLPYYDTVWYVF